ncbi:retrovirus-related pol polyprotein from transposon TNT 1-94 [Tanacetum coccineum]
MEAAVDQCLVDKNILEIQIKQLRIDNDQLLNQIMSQEIVYIVANFVDICDMNKSCVNDCKKCLELEIELFKKKDFIEKEAYDKLVKSYSNLEKHCISLKLATQLNQEIFQGENSVIRKLKERIKSLSGKDSVENVKKDIDEIETINIELEHKHCDSLIAQINAKFVENSNLNAQLQETVFAITTLINELRKLKGKNAVNIVVSKPNATLAPGMFKLNIKALSPRLKNNRGAHEVYIEKTIEYADTLRRFVECPNSPKPSEKLVAVTPSNKDKRVRFAEPVTSLRNIPKQTDYLKTKDSNKPLLTSTGVKPTTSASGLKPTDNTKKNRITRPPRNNQKNKVEDHPRIVKSCLNKTNSVSKPISNVLVKHSVKNAKFESICAICKKCCIDPIMISYIDHVNDVNVRPKSKSKRNKKRKAWKPTGNPMLQDVPSSSSLVNDRLSISSSGIWTSINDQVAKIKVVVGGLSAMEHVINRTGSKDEAPNAIIKCIKNIQVRLNATVHNVRTDNGTGFVNQTLRDFYENVGISHQTSVARTTQQNSIVKR